MPTGTLFWSVFSLSRVETSKFLAGKINEPASFYFQNPLFCGGLVDLSNTRWKDP